jgi:DNA-binding Lrp family transcriptional regulator
VTIAEAGGMGIDRLDGRIIVLLAREPRLGVLEMSRRLGVARGTVQARLDRLQSNGVVRGFGPDVDPAALGYPVTAFATLQIRQGRGAAVRAHLGSVPEVLELHTTTGGGDMLCRLVARSNADLQRVIDRVVGFDGIVRASTAIVMENPVPLRIIPLVEQAAEQAAERAPERTAERAAGRAGEDAAERER